MNMKKEVFLSAIFSVITLTVAADEYIDPQTNAVYTYEPGQNIASVKAGYEEVIDMGPGYELEVVYHSGSPDAAGDVVILERFNIGTAEYVVTSIGEGAFKENSNINSISIPETVTDIGASAFEFCINLSAVHLPEGLTQLSQRLFWGCSKLMSVNIPSTVRTICSYAFNGCRSLANLTLPTSLSFIGRGAFYATPWYDALYSEAPDGPLYIGSQLFAYKGDKPTGEFVIKEGTTCVGYEALRGCDRLTSVTIPSSVNYVDNEAFYGCTGLQAVNITDLVAWCSITFQAENRNSSNPLSKAHHLYLNGEEVTDLVIPEGVTSIGDYAFDYCTALTSVTIPDGVTTIGTNAFRGCESLINVTIPSSITTIGANAFIWCFNLDTVHISNLTAWCGISFYGTANPLYYGAHLFLNGNEVTDLVIPNGVTNILDGAFFGFKHLKSVTIPYGVSSIGEKAFSGCSALASVTFPKSLKLISNSAFSGCSCLANANISEGVTSIGEGAFSGCSALVNVTIPSTVRVIEYSAFYNCWALSSVISKIEEPSEIVDEVFERYNSETYETSFTPATLYVPKGCKEHYESTAGWNNFEKIVELSAQDDYCPMIEDGKVWKTGSTTGISDGIVKMVEYYYFDGDTIIDGKTCKQMMCQRYVNPNHPDYAVIMQYPLLRHAGVWYEEDKKVYIYDTTNKQFQMMYDFSLEANETLQIHEYDLYVVGPRQTGGLEGFKGVYRDVMFYSDEDPYYCTTWLEGVGGIDGPTRNVYYGKENHPEFLMSCTVGDEVIYLNDEYEDGATPEGMGAAKKRFDFTHTTKLKPKAPEVKAPRRSETEQSLYGEYNDLQLGINLDPLDDAYQVTITNESGKVVYEKAINAGTIVGLSIDISDYAKGRYTVTVENSLELFVGEFEAQTTGIVEVRNNKEETSGHIYNLQGLRVNSLQKGLNIVNGQKVYVK